MIEKNICKNCKELLLYRIEVNKKKLWGFCKECFEDGWIPNPPYNRYIKKQVGKG